MATKKEETASFVLRLSQKIFESEEGSHDVTWRGNIRHVQSGEEARFSTFEEAEGFVKEKLTKLTLNAVEDKPEETKKGVLAKSFEFWKSVASATPKLVMDSIKDPKKQAEQLQDQLQHKIQDISDAIGQKFDEKIGSKIELDQLLPASRSEILSKIDLLNGRLDSIEKKLDKINTKK
jgi:tetrahydromethanopterin S-methyltransferase subunit G